MVVNSGYNTMEIKSIARTLGVFYGRVKETVYTTKIDANNKQFVEQVVYLKSGKLEPLVGSQVDTKV